MPCAAAGAERSPGTRQGRRHGNLRAAVAPAATASYGPGPWGWVPHIPPTCQPLSPRPRSQGGCFALILPVVARPDIIPNDSARPLFPGCRRCRGLHRAAPPGNTAGIPELERGTCRPRGWVQHQSHGPGTTLVLPAPRQGQTVPGETKAGSTAGRRAGQPLVLGPCAGPARGIRSLLGDHAGSILWRWDVVPNPRAMAPALEQAARPQGHTETQCHHHAWPRALLEDQDWNDKPVSPAWDSLGQKLGLEMPHYLPPGALGRVGAHPEWHWGCQCTWSRPRHLGAGDNGLGLVPMTEGQR